MVDEEDEETIDYSKFNMVELQDILSDMYDKIPKDKRKRGYIIFLEDYNNLVNLYNNRANAKIYANLKK